MRGKPEGIPNRPGAPLGIARPTAFLRSSLVNGRPLPGYYRLSTGVHPKIPCFLAVFCRGNISKTNIDNWKYEDHYRSVIPVLRIWQNAPVGPSKTNVATCSTCFIRSRSGSVLRFPRFAATGKIEASWAERDDTANSAIIGYAHDDNSRLIGAVDPSRLLLYCQHIAV